MPSLKCKLWMQVAQTPISGLPSTYLPAPVPGPRDADGRVHELIQERHVVSCQHTVRAQRATVKVHRVC